MKAWSQRSSVCLYFCVYLPLSLSPSHPHIPSWPPLSVHNLSETCEKYISSVCAF
jgi:hypothetical protein